MEINFKSFKNFLEFIELKYGVRLHFSSFVECGFIDNSLTETLSYYSIHDCDYCKFIKSNKYLWQKCVRVKNRIQHKLTTEKTFYVGVCHAGVLEYIMPFLYKDMVIGYVSVSGMKAQDIDLEKRFSKLKNHYSLSESELESYYNDLRIIGESDKNALKTFLTLISEQISNTFSLLVDAYNIDFKTKPVISKKIDVLQMAREFISKNLSNEISVKDLSRFCHCSESYLQHVFKEAMGVSITKYVNNLRIEKAKFFLARTDLPVIEIAQKVGFKDSNYFSKSFLTIVGTSPSAFRKSNIYTMA